MLSKQTGGHQKTFLVVISGKKHVTCSFKCCCLLITKYLLLKYVFVNNYALINEHFKGGNKLN